MWIIIIVVRVTRCACNNIDGRVLVEYYSFNRIHDKLYGSVWRKHQDYLTDEFIVVTKYIVITNINVIIRRYLI